MVQDKRKPALDCWEWPNRKEESMESGERGSMDPLRILEKG